jgi:hypothetical protein
MSRTLFGLIIAISIIRMVAVLIGCLVFIQLYDRALTYPRVDGRVTAVFFMSLAWICLPGMATFFHLARMWAQRRRKIPWGVARWRCARIDVFAAPVILLVLFLGHLWAFLLAFCVFSVGLTLAARRTPRIDVIWPTEVLQIFGSVIVAVTSGILAYSLLIDQQTSASVALVNVGLTVWLWLIAMLCWHNPDSPDVAQDVF